MTLFNESLIREHIPDFTLLKIQDILGISMRFRYEGTNPRFQCLDISVEFNYSYSDALFSIGLLLTNVRKLTLPEMGTSMFELGELTIQKMAQASPDGAEYCVVDHLDGLFCYCQKAEYEFIRKSP